MTKNSHDHMAAETMVPTPETTVPKPVSYPGSKPETTVPKPVSYPGSKPETTVPKPVTTPGYP
jgi:hypothetical protein